MTMKGSLLWSVFLLILQLEVSQGQRRLDGQKVHVFRGRGEDVLSGLQCEHHPQGYIVPDPLHCDRSDGGKCQDDCDNLLQVLGLWIKRKERDPSLSGSRGELSPGAGLLLEERRTTLLENWKDKKMEYRHHCNGNTAISGFEIQESSSQYLLLLFSEPDGCAEGGGV